MVERRFVKQSVHTIEQLYNLALDVKSYPKFLPWCTASRVIEDTDTEMIADLVISFSGFREKYKSKILKYPFDKEKNIAQISVNLVEGPFEFLQNEWKFKELDNGMTSIEFYINFKFSSTILDRLIGMVFEKAMSKMIEAFEKRADELYL